MMRARVLVTAAAVSAIAGFTVATLLLYNFRPTAGTVFLSLGWISILATAYFLVRAVSTFDLRVGVEMSGNLTADRRAELEREKKLLVKAIKEAEFDRDSGKLDGGEAASAIARYRARAVEILRLLEEGPALKYEAIIEKELARRLAAAGPLSKAEAKAEAKAAAEAEGAPEAASSLCCPSCQTRNDHDAAFCKKCGAKLETA